MLPPHEIDTFVDAFTGSGIVSMNTKAKRYILNDIDEHLAQLYSLFSDNTAESIIAHIEEYIEKYELPKERTKRNVFSDKEKIEKYKSSYFAFRDEYNKDKSNTFMFYTLMFFSFSQQFRFNGKGEFNMPFGNDCFTDKNKEYIRNGCNFFQNNDVVRTAKDFRGLDYDKLTQNDFVYFDPPYSITLSVYNENRDGRKGWTTQDDKDLFEICDSLTANGVKFAMSNVFSNKGNINDELITWCERNKYNVYSFDSHTYTACGKGNSNAKEVLIMNY